MNYRTRRLASLTAALSWCAEDALVVGSVRGFMWLDNLTAMASCGDYGGVHRLLTQLRALIDPRHRIEDGDHIVAANLFTAGVRAHIVDGDPIDVGHHLPR